MSHSQDHGITEILLLPQSWLQLHFIGYTGEHCPNVGAVGGSMTRGGTLEGGHHCRAFGGWNEHQASENGLKVIYNEAGLGISEVLLWRNLLPPLTTESKHWR